MSIAKTITKLVKYYVEKDREFELDMDKVGVITTRICGPEESLYENGNWRVQITIPEDFPNSAPVFHFIDRILHPNVDSKTGFVRYEAVDWGDGNDMGNQIDHVIRALLEQPNFKLPMNVDAAKLYWHDGKEYKDMIKMAIEKQAVDQDTAERQFVEADGDDFEFDKCCVADGEIGDEMVVLQDMVEDQGERQFVEAADGDIEMVCVGGDAEVDIGDDGSSRRVRRRLG